MNFVRTVCGDIDSSELGSTQCHEHLFIREGVSALINPSLCIESSLKVFQELQAYKACGGGALVDAQPVGCGRMPRLLEEVSEASGVHIIASTGFHKMTFYPDNHWIRKMDAENLANIFIDELEKGMYIHCDTEAPKERISSKAGMIKVALDSEGLTDTYKILHKAAIIASLKTGIPVQCHIEDISNANGLLDFYENHNYPLSRLILAHTDRSMNNLDETLKLLKRGIFVQLDTIGRFKYHSDEEEVVFINSLIQNGFESKILLGLDTTRERLKAYGSVIGLSYIKDGFVGKMTDEGIGVNSIQKMLFQNPQEALMIF